MEEELKKYLQILVIRYRIPFSIIFKTSILAQRVLIKRPEFNSTPKKKLFIYVMCTSLALKYDEHYIRFDKREIQKIFREFFIQTKFKLLTMEFAMLDILEFDLNTPSIIEIVYPHYQNFDKTFFSICIYILDNFFSITNTQKLNSIVVSIVKHYKTVEFFVFRDKIWLEMFLYLEKIPSYSCLNSLHSRCMSLSESENILLTTISLRNSPKFSK